MVCNDYNECVFCDRTIVGYGTLNKNSSCYVLKDIYPVSKGHRLIIPYRHVETVFDLTDKELSDMMDLMKKQKEELDKLYKPDGYNIGWNCGEAAGQTVSHCHLHIIPRYKDDIEDPRGGIRGCIPEKRFY